MLTALAPTREQLDEAINRLSAEIEHLGLTRPPPSGDWKVHLNMALATALQDDLNVHDHIEKTRIAILQRLLGGPGLRFCPHEMAVGFYHWTKPYLTEAADDPTNKDKRYWRLNAEVINRLRLVLRLVRGQQEMF